MGKIIFTVVLTLVLFFLTGCTVSYHGLRPNVNNKTLDDYLVTSEPRNTSELPEVEEYAPPAKVLEIDLDAADPSNDYIRFKYDEQGRID